MCLFGVILGLVPKKIPVGVGDFQPLIARVTIHDQAPRILMPQRASTSRATSPGLNHVASDRCSIGSVRLSANPH